MLFRLYILPLLLITSRFSFSQSPEIYWQNNYGGSYTDQAHEIIVLDDTSFMVCGYARSDDYCLNGNKGDDDFWFVMINDYGNIIWQKNYGGEYSDWAHSIDKTIDNGFIAGGFSYSSSGDVTENHGQSDYWIVKLDSQGNLVWQRSYGGSSYEYCHQVIQNQNNNFIAAGFTQSTNGNITGNKGQSDYWVMELDSLGNMKWQKCYGGSSFDLCYSVQEVIGNGYILAGYTLSNDLDVSGNHGGNDYWIVKINDTGSIEWQKCMGGSFDDRAYCVRVDQDNGYIIAGFSSSEDGDVTYNNGANDYWVIKLNSNGDLEWQRCFGGSNDDRAYTIDLTSDGGYIVGGYSKSMDGDVAGNHGEKDYWLIKITELGELEWQKCLGGSLDEEVYSVAEISYGEYIVAGGSWSLDGDITENYGNDDYWIVRLTSMFGLESPDFNTKNIIVQPNPTKGIVNFLLMVNHQQLITLKIYDMKGMEITTVVNNIYLAGEHCIQWNAEGLPAGMYYFRIQAGDKVGGGKILKMR
jgi:hypothetical protein